METSMEIGPVQSWVDVLGMMPWAVEAAFSEGSMNARPELADAEHLCQTSPSYMDITCMAVQGDVGCA